MNKKDEENWSGYYSDAPLRNADEDDLAEF